MLRVAAPDGNVGNGGYGAAAQPLQGPPGDQHRHRRRQAADQQPAGEEEDAQREGQRGTPFVGEQPGDDDADKLGEEEGGEGPAVEVEPAEIGDDGRQHGRHRQGFEGDDDDGEDETKREGDAAGTEGAAVLVVRGSGPRGEDVGICGRQRPIAVGGRGLPRSGSILGCRPRWHRCRS